MSLTGRRRHMLNPLKSQGSNKTVSKPGLVTQKAGKPGSKERGTKEGKKE
jgi:hypothetical protein